LVPVKSIEVSGRSIGNSSPCFIIAEAGVNHNGSLELAHRLVDRAAEAGADAVKFQIFNPDLLAARETPMAEYQAVNTGLQQSQLAMLRQLALPRSAFQELAQHAADRGLIFLSTAFDPGSADLLEDLGILAYKVSSGDLTNYDLLAHMARKGKPLLISTGMSTLSEVGEALAVVRASGCPAVALFHCVTNYPASPGECNLRAMETMRRTFLVPVGWSDHTMGLHITTAAIAMGAEMLEKHFTLDCGLPGPDHRASLEPRDLTALVKAVRAVEAARGDGVKVPALSEAVNAPLVRRSLHIARDLTADHVLTDADLLALRPGTGIPPSARNQVIGRLLRVPLKAGELLREDHLG
jgi:N,N'-diacetyllegionaminate synthase